MTGYEPVKTRLRSLIVALKAILDDDRDFDLSHYVSIQPDRIEIVSDGFLYQKLKWALQNEDRLPEEDLDPWDLTVWSIMGAKRRLDELTDQFPDDAFMDREAQGRFDRAFNRLVHNFGNQVLEDLRELKDARDLLRRLKEMEEEP